ncbi:MAG: transglycosylase family protein [Thermoleophilaceae bacterium]
MRKILASTVGGALAVVPVTAFAATAEQGADQQGNPLTTASQAFHPLERRAHAEEAAEQLSRARAKVERKTREQRARADRRRKRRGGSNTGGGSVAVSPALQSIAACESGGNPSAIGGGGLYRGKYQFSRSTWASVGGSGDPAAASEAEQDRRAAMLYARAGASPWPVCGA